MLGVLVALAALPVLAAAARVASLSDERHFDVADAPARDVGMVLGARAFPSGPSAFLAARLDVAIDLYERGLIRAILVTGDGRPGSHNEPLIMRTYLEEHGIPAERIVEDPAGFDTYDSCVRARDVFGVTEVTIITQGYHLNRAVAACRAVGVDAVGVGDQTMLRRYPYNWAKGWVREWPANLKLFWDVWQERQPQKDPPNEALLEAAGR